MHTDCNSLVTVCASKTSPKPSPLDPMQPVMERSHPTSGRSATPADINRNGRPTSIGTSGRHQSECPADIIGMRNCADSRVYRISHLARRSPSALHSDDIIGRHTGTALGFLSTEVTPPGYYLAVYDGSVYGDSVALLEAYDTWLDPVLSFDQFKSAVPGLYGSTRFTATGTNTYVTRSGQVIQFTISPETAILSTGLQGEFAYGDIINSAQGSGVITIRNPRRAPGWIILDMHDALNPTRTELGDVERGGIGGHEE